MAEKKRKAVQVRVEGRVQGVGFRAWTFAEATRLGLDGWVRNETDGTVTAAFEGTEEKISAMLARLRLGPPGSAVTEIGVEDAVSESAEPGFRIRR